MRTLKSTITLALVLSAALGGCASTAHETTASNAGRASATAKVSRIVEGDLDVSNETSLAELAELEIVTGTLTIEGNTRLTELDGLEHLRAVGALVVKENLSLTNLDALGGLRHAKSVTISGNPHLENLHGLESLKVVDRLVVTKNGIFCTSGLNGLERAGDIVISENPRLLSLRGLGNLRSARDVTIVKNPRLSAQTGMLEKLSQVSGELTIRMNGGLEAGEVSDLVERLGSGGCGNGGSEQQCLRESNRVHAGPG